MSLRQSPLSAEHASLGARFTEFGGWEMPLSYPAGTIAEHLACRRDAVVFDVSHLGTVRVRGARARDVVQAAFTNDLDKIAPGRAQYTHLLDEYDASVLDDCIVWWLDDETIDVMPNASNTARVRDAVGGEEVTATRAICAVQGPSARARLASVAPGAAAVERFHVTPFTFEGVECLAAGTGYTGEDGVECAVPNAVAPAFWRAVLATGVLPAGLGARDTLRLEAALPLHGHELGGGITPLQAGLGWVVAFAKGPFRGRAALEAERDRGVTRRLRHLLGVARRPLHAGESCVHEGEEIGFLTSGNYSPLLNRGIAPAFLPPEVPDGELIEVRSARGTFEATVVHPPFHRLVLDGGAREPAG